MSTKSRQFVKDRALRRKRNNQFKSLAFIVGGILLLIGTFVFLPPDKPAEASLNINPSNLSTQSPIQAIHEMSGPSLAAIQFLPKDQGQPKIAVSETFYEFGLIGKTEKVTRDFIIQNIGEGVLTISRAYTTCGCTIADFTATVIPPGGHIIMTLVFDAGFHDAAGQSVRRGILIENNDPDLPQLEIWIEANISNN